MSVEGNLIEIEDYLVDLSKTLQKPYQAKALSKRTRMTLVSVSYM